MVSPLFAGLAFAGALPIIAAVPTAAQSTDSLQLTGAVGVVNTAGNTDLTTVNVGEEVRWRHGPLGLGQTFSVVYGRSDGGDHVFSLARRLCGATRHCLTGPLRMLRWRTIGTGSRASRDVSRREPGLQ